MSSETNSNADSTLAGELEAKMILQRYLTPGENLLWTDKPRARWKQDLKGLWFILTLFLLFFLFPVVNFIVQTTNTSKSETADLPRTQQDTLLQKAQDKLLRW